MILKPKIVFLYFLIAVLSFSCKENKEHSAELIVFLDDLYTLINKKDQSSVKGYGKILIHFNRKNEVEDLFFGEFNLSEIPASINNLKNLNTLVISDCKLEKLPDLKLDKLETLSLDGNEFKEITPDFKNLINLLELNLNRNKFEGTLIIKNLPEELRTLDLSNNTIDNIIIESHLPYLYSLNLSNTLITDIDTSICKLPKLQYLHLSNNKLEGLKQKIETELECLKNVEIDTTKKFEI